MVRNNFTKEDGLWPQTKSEARIIMKSNNKKGIWKFFEEEDKLLKDRLNLISVGLERLFPGIERRN
jgi:hypothetical protein